MSSPEDAGDAPPRDDDPMLGLDPWTAGYIRMRQFLESGPRTEAEVDELGDAIRSTLPFPDPPPDIALVIQADLRSRNELTYSRRGSMA
jgi:hypothetical protein